MIKEFKERFVNNEYMHFIEQYTIVSDYYSKDGNLLETSTEANTQNISVSYDIIMVTHTDKSESSMLETQPSITKYSKVITTKHVDEISSIIENMISSKLTNINIEVDSQSSDIVLSDRLLLKLFNYFNYVNIDNGKFESSKIILPDGDFSLNGFSISGGTMMFPDKFIIHTKDTLEISSANIKCEVSSNPTIQVVGKYVYLDQLNFTQPVKIITGIPYQDNSDEFADTQINLSKLYFDLNGFDDDSVSKDPLISVESNNHTDISDVNLIGGSYKNFIKFSGVKDVVITGINRLSKTINAYSIGLDSVRSIKVSDAIIRGDLVSENKVNFMEFDTTTTSILDTVDLRNLNLLNCGLASLDSLRIKSFIVHNCSFEGKQFLSTSNNFITKVSIVDSRLDISEESLFEGESIDFSNTILISEKSNVTIYGKNSINISNSKINCENNDLTFKLEGSCNTSIKNSDILAKDFVIGKTDQDPSPFVQLMDLAAIKKLKIANTNLKLGGKFDISGVDNQKYDGVKFTNAVSITVADATSLYAQLIALNVDKIIPIKFSSVKFKRVYIASESSPSKIPLDIYDSSGELYFIVKDLNTEKRNSCDIDVYSINSKIGLNIGSDSFTVRAKIKTSNSLGSCFFGGNNVTVIPELKSTDIDSFKRVEIPMKKFDAVCYGNSSS